MNNKASKVLFIVFSSIFAFILIAGIVFLSVFGFNLSIGLAGGEKISITATNAGIIDENVYAQQFVQKQNEIISKSKQALRKFGKINVEAQILGEAQDQTIIIKFKDDKNMTEDEILAQNAQITDEIKNSIAGVSSLELTVSNPVKISKFSYINWGVEAVAVCALVFIVFAFFMIRGFTSGALSVLIGMVISCLSFLSILAFSRLELTKYIGVSLIICVLLTALIQILILNKIKNLYKSSKGNDSGIISRAVKANLFETILLCSIICALGIVLMFFNLALGLYVFVSALIVCLVNLFIIPGFMQIFTAKSGLKIKFNNFNK